MTNNKIYLTLPDEKIEELKSLAAKKGLKPVHVARMFVYEGLGRKE